MTESEELNLTNDEQFQKSISFYEIMLSSFIESRNEFDKQLLTISVAALGFSLSFFDKLINSSSTLYLFVFSIVLYLLTIVSILLIFSYNSKYIEKELKSESDEALKIANTLDRSDMFAKFTFATASILTVTLFLILVFSETDKKLRIKVSRASILKISVPSFCTKTIEISSSIFYELNNSKNKFYKG